MMKGDWPLCRKEVFDMSYSVSEVDEGEDDTVNKQIKFSSKEIINFKIITIS